MITVGRLGVLQSAPPVPALHQIKGLSSESMRSLSANECLPYNTAERVIHAHVNRLLRNAVLSHQSVNPCRFQAAYSKPSDLLAHHTICSVPAMVMLLCYMCISAEILHRPEDRIIKRLPSYPIHVLLHSWKPVCDKSHLLSLYNHSIGYSRHSVSTPCILQVKAQKSRSDPGHACTSPVTAMASTLSVNNVSQD